MKKLTPVTVSLLLFLMLSAIIVLPTQAKPEIAFASSLQVRKSSDDTYILETDKMKITVEQLSTDHSKLSWINPNGSMTTCDIIGKGFNATILINGVEAYKFPVNQTKQPQSNGFAELSNLNIDNPTIASQPENPPALLDTSYWWDGVRFVEGLDIAYPHADRAYYGISRFADWTGIGNLLYHTQWNDAFSRLIGFGGPVVIGAAIGAAVGVLIGGTAGAIIGPIVGAVIGVILYYVADWKILDEMDCLWWWISQAFIGWLYGNAWWLEWLYWIGGEAAVFPEIMTAFLWYGYIRVGSLTFHDAVGAGTPSGGGSQHYWVSSISDYSWYGTAAGVDNPNNLVGSSNDGQYAHLHAGEYHDQAVIVGAMNAEAHGHIELYGYSGAGYNSHLYVYVSYDYSNWYLVRDFYVSQSSPHWIDCWTYSSNFRYIAITIYRDAGYSACLYVDSVKVTP